MDYRTWPWCGRWRGGDGVVDAGIRFGESAKVHVCIYGSPTSPALFRSEGVDAKAYIFLTSACEDNV